METHMLEEYLRDGRIRNAFRVLDCTYYIPGDSRNAKKQFEEERIPYSTLFDIDEVKDKGNNLPHMMITNEKEFVEHMKRLDIRKNDTIVCYDRHGIFSAPRVWYNLTIYGAPDVFILNGGFPKWKSENRQTEIGMERGELIRPLDTKTNEFDYKLDKSKLIGLTELLERIDTKSCEIIDARPAERYRGEVDEPRPAKHKGHIKGAKNVFFKNVIDEKGCMKRNSEIMKAFHNGGVKLNAKEFDLYCGSGITACLDAFALSQLGKFDRCKLYDGSWAEAVSLY
jgi:thiosulfate/3-mercaptopyruvate sulfurtransferase